MRTSDELKARLPHSTHEIAQLQQMIATASDQAQTTYNEVQLCKDRVGLLDAAFNALNHQNHALVKEMDRVYALRNDESDLYLRHENSKLKRDLAALQQALQQGRDEQQAQLANAVQSNEELAQRMESVERFNKLLISKLNEMKEMYESAIIEVTDLKAKNKTLHNISGKCHIGHKLSLGSTDDLQLSMSLQIPPLPVTQMVAT